MRRIFLFCLTSLLLIASAHSTLCADSANPSKQSVQQADEQKIQAQLNRMQMEPNNLQAVETGWIPYYYRHGRQDEILQAMQVLTETAGWNNRDRWFFATLFQRHPEALTELKQKMAQLPPSEQAQLSPHIARIENFLPDSDVFEPDQVLYDFAVTGDLTLIDQLYSRLEKCRNTELKARLRDHCITLGLLYFPAYLHYETLLKQGKKPLLQEIVDELKTKYFYPAGNFGYRANNHINNREYGAAINEALRGLAVAPDYPWLQQLLATAFMSTRDFDRAQIIFLFSTFDAMDHTRLSTLNNLGAALDAQNKYAESVKLYTQTDKEFPHTQSVISRLAVAWEHLGNIEMAAKYYRLCYDFDMTPDIARSAALFFRRNHLPIPKIKETPRNLLLQKRYIELDELFVRAQQKREKDNEGHFVIYSLYKELLPASPADTGIFRQLLPLLEGWVKEMPDSCAAHTAQGNILWLYGWNARGQGYAGTVGKKNFELFHKRIRRAASELEKACALNPDAVGAPTMMISVAKVHPDWPEEKVEEWFRKALAIAPGDYDAYRQRALYLSPEWGGSRAEQYALARRVFRDAPSDSMAPALINLISWAEYTRDRRHDLYQTPLWKEIKMVDEEMLRRFPHADKLRNQFAKFSCLAEDYATTKQQLEILGSRINMEEWQGKEQLEYCRKMAGMK